MRTPRPRRKGKSKERASMEIVSDEEFATQGFEPHESDVEQLWDVVAIKGERKGMYLAQWAGADENGKPWDDSWVPREDITNDLVEAWKKKKTEKKRKPHRISERREQKKRQGSAVSASRSRTDSKKSTGTASNITPRRSQQLPSSITADRVDMASVSTVRSSPTKNRKQLVLSDAGNSFSDDGHVSTRKKKRKVSPDNELQQLSPRKRFKRRPPDSEQKVGSDREEKVDSEDGTPLPVEHSERESLRADTDAKTGLQSRTDVRCDEDEDEVEEEEEGHIAGGSKAPMDRRGKSISPPDMTSKSEEKSEPVGGSPDRAALPDTDRISDRRPTPPRRTLAKSSSGPSENRIFADSHVHDKLKKGGKRRGPPGIRIGSEFDLFLPEIGKSTETPDDFSIPGSDATERMMGGQHNRSRSHSIEPEQNIIVTPSRLRRGLTARMKGKERPKADSGKPESKSVSGFGSCTASIEQENADKQANNLDDDQRKAQRRRSCSVTKPVHDAPTSPPAFLPDDPDVAITFTDDMDDGLAFDHSAHDEALHSQDNDPIPPAVEVPTLDTPTRPDSNVSLAANGVAVSAQESAADVGSETRSENDSLALKGAIIPATQSQSQSQSHSEIQNRARAQDSVQFASVLAEHGSIAVDASANTDDLMSSAPQASSIDADLPPSTADQSVTDPEPSADPNKHTKVHKKIPVVTPSKFRPYLPQSQKPLSALPLPHIQGMQNTAAQGRNDGPVSSLESPVKDFDTDEPATGAQDNRSDVDQNSQVKLSEGDDIEYEMPRSLKLQQRGLELAELRRRSIREEVREPVPRIQLVELLGGVSKSSSSRRQSRESDVGNPSAPDLEPSDTLPRAALGSTLGADEEEEDDLARIHKFEQDYLDFDGDVGDISAASVGHRPALADVNEAPNTLDEHSQDQPPVEAERDTHEEADVESSVQDATYEDDPFLSRGIANERAVTPTTTTSQQDDLDLLHTPAQARFRILGSPSKLESPVQTPSRQLNEAMGLLHAKSEEIEYLKRQFAESERKRLIQDDVLAELQAENLVLKKSHEEPPGSFSGPGEGELDRYREKYESLSKDRDALDAEIKLLQMSRDDSIKQVEIFRELYGKASSFVDEMKQENEELLERAKRAEGQASIGLDLVRRQYATQEHKLNAELEQQRILVHVLSTKDRRTDDEVRRRAALEPELRGEIDRLREGISDLEASQSRLVHARDELLVEKRELSGKLDDTRAEYKKMAGDMCWLQIRVARLTAREKAFKKVFLTTSESVHDDDPDRGEEKVYICKWIMNHDSHSRCNSIFTNVQDLQDHLFVDHQL